MALRLGLIIFLGLLSLGSFASPQQAFAQETPRIEWRLENPFRFFRDAKDTERFRAEYSDLNDSERKNPILSIERRLERKSDGWGWAESFFPADGSVSKTEEDACWYQDRKCHDYVMPRSHKILAHIAGLSQPCEWRVNDKTAAEAADCAQDVVLRVPYPKGARIGVKSGDIAQTIEVKITDLLVVSLGDSFAAGEGNPDRAVRFAPHLVTNYGGGGLRGYPARAGVNLRGGDVLFPSDERYARTRAHWLHESCHRSLYSNHLRAALQLALDDPKGQTSVTYLSVACTGAGILQGLFKPWNGTGAVTGSAVALPQLSGISNAICETSPAPKIALQPGSDRIFRGVRQIPLNKCPKEKARKIDLVFLSIGGNDIGFSNLVANAALKFDPGITTLAPLFGTGKLKIGVREAAARAASLPAKYGALAKALSDILHISDPKRVLLTAYPRMSFNENGEACTSGAAGMDVSSMFKLDSPKAIEEETFIEQDLTPLMKRAACANGWTFVDRYREDGQFKTHGICAQTEEERGNSLLSVTVFPRRIPPVEVAANSRGAQARETASIAGGEALSRRPRLFTPAGYGLIQTAEAASQWQPFSPDRYRPYISRQRWFRTPNDAFLTAHHSDVKPLGGLEAITRFSAYSGAFHPTAEGQAALADALFAKAKDVLNGGASQACPANP